MNTPIRPNQEDRYVSPNSPQKPLLAKSTKSILSKKKWIILILALCLIVGIVVSTLFKSTSSESAIPSDASNSGVNSDNRNTEYQQLTPPPISTTATETKLIPDSNEERIEISGEVIDILAEKINELNSAETVAVLLKGQNKSTDQTTKELLLETVLDNNHYTIQLNSSSSIENLMAFVKQNKLTNYQIYETYREQKPWFVLIKGRYATLEDAKQAILSLSLELQKSHPWIKSGESVNKEKLLK